MYITDIMVPAFASDLIDRSRCDQCGEVGRWWIKAAGARLDAENQACFFVTLWCSECEEKHEIIFSSRRFYREEWWHDVAAWFGDASRPDRVGAVLRNMPMLKDVTVLYRQRQRVKRLQLYGGYSGDCGPLILLYHRVASTHPQNAYGVVRLEPKDRLRFLPCSDPEALAFSKWLWFRDLDHGDVFGHKGRSWHKLSPDRIREIIRDRVFETWTVRHRRSTVPKAHRRGTARG